MLLLAGKNSTTSNGLFYQCQDFRSIFQSSKKKKNLSPLIYHAEFIVHVDIRSFIKNPLYTH